MLSPRFSFTGVRLGKALSIVMIASVVLTSLALLQDQLFAANPAPQQIYYVTLPEDDLLQLFDDNQVTLGSWPQVVSPIRSVTSISIGSTGTLVYWDQWEDGGYDADIANPAANVYNASTNPDGTQIWGDGVLSNGCPPTNTKVPKPITQASNDQLQAGDVIILDNDVVVGGTTPGPYTRNPALIFYDGRDKFGTSFPVAVTRAAFPPIPGSVMAGANEVLDTGRWGTSYEAPLGEDTVDTNTNAFEDVRWFIMAGVGGATIDVDANGDGTIGGAPDLNDFVMAQGAKVQVNGILMGATLALVSGNPVQVNSMTADVNDTFEFRWDALIPRDDWSNNYYTPVGTAPKASNSGCTEVEIYNPNATPITINYDFPGGASPNGSFNVAAGQTATGLTTPATPLVPYNNGGRYWSEGGQDFLPISVTDCTRDTSGTEGRLYDWGNPLFPADQLTTQILVPFAQGCSGESFLGVCRDADSQSPYDTRDITTDGSRSVVWVTPLANTTIYLDYDGSGFSCPGGVGSDTSIAASALVSYRFDADPTSRAYVRDGFASQAYNLTSNIGQGWPQPSAAWSSDWIETNDDGAANAGAILVNAANQELRFQGSGTANETGRYIRRSKNLTGQNYANLRFQLRGSGLASTDRLAVEVTSDGTNWIRLAEFRGDLVAGAFSPISASSAFNISPYISTSTAVRFIILTDITGTDFWALDNVHIDYAVGGDWDMTGARIGTCDGTEIAAAWGQDPALSAGNDEEALDMGTGIAPFGSAIAIDKSADKTVVAQGGLVNYSFDVTNLGSVNLKNISVTDDRCSPAVYVSGDNNPADNFLNPFPAETWKFTCSSNIYFDTTNVAFATGTPELQTTPINSAPDEWTVVVVPPAAIGNYVWLDEDGDGDQDAGEAGIPNVQVNLTGTDNQGKPVNLTTYTDANGGYLFDGLSPSDAAGYTITVVPPAGLNNTYDEDTGTASPNNTTTVVLAAGDEHLTADFGYNWAPPGATNNPPNGATGAIGDRVWIDDGDGIQEPGESGLGGVTVTLYHDPDGNGVYDTPYIEGGYIPVRVTDAAGNYIFDDLPAGAYVVVVTPPTGYSQTGDPDQFGATCTACDNRTTTPVVLGPGDVYVNADFGYRPTGPSGSIGDTVWLDANRDNTQNAGENGIPGVTVSLIRDINGNGAWNAGEPVIATDITDENGQYLFSGLPIDDGTGTDDYLVWVNDTNNVLGELAPTYDVRDGANQGNPATGVEIGLEISAVTNLDGTPVTNADFAYAPPGHDAGEGLIGDTIWLDRTNFGTYDPGEGLEGVRVRLTDPGPDGILGTADDTTRDTFTDENGNYYFGGLEPSLSYRVTVDPLGTTLPAGVTNTVDPDSTTDSTTVRNLASTGPIDLAADFAYRDLTQPNTIGGTLWEDLDADGTLEVGEALRFQGVTVVLYNAAGNIVATTTTDSNGDYSFTGLPDGTYTVDVTDDDNVLFGYWKSNGPNAGVDNNSQVDPYTVSVSGGQTNTTGDFGYYVDPAGLGNFVWDDLNKDGIQDLNEPGIPNVEVTLTITWPNGDTTTIKTKTDPNGYYNFGNLLLDEDYRVSSGTTTPATNQPAFVISVATPSGYSPTGISVPGSTPDNDSNDPAGTAAASVQGSVNETYDFGWVQKPLAVSLGYAYAERTDDGVRFTWETASESGNAGFNLYMEQADGSRSLITQEMIPSTVIDSVTPVRYTHEANVAGDRFLVEMVNISGARNLFGPFDLGKEFGKPSVPEPGDQTKSLYLPLITNGQ